MGITRKSLNRTKKKSVFRKSDYKSGDGMLTSVWGPSLWHSLHTVSFNYPLNPSMDDKKRYRQFILQLKYVLPCKYCRINLKQNFKCLPLQMKDMNNRETFSRYIYQLHELVNKMLGKKSGLSYEQVRERYEHFRARCNKGKIIRKTIKRKKENGCIEPLYGKKSKCIIKIVPQDTKCETFQMNPKCETKRLD
jgi:hypothetical protein|tara:strand:- start:8836 stop:9414 length:579 start_codon:yes stop_codon:yes gene_type:complete